MTSSFWRVTLSIKPADRAETIIAYVIAQLGGAASTLTLAASTAPAQIARPARCPSGFECELEEPNRPKGETGAQRIARDGITRTALRVLVLELARRPGPVEVDVQVRPLADRDR